MIKIPSSTLKAMQKLTSSPAVKDMQKIASSPAVKKMMDAYTSLEPKPAIRSLSSPEDKDEDLLPDIFKAIVSIDNNAERRASEASKLAKIMALETATATRRALWANIIAIIAIIITIIFNKNIISNFISQLFQ